MRARTSAMTASRSFGPSPSVLTGAPIRTDSVTGRTIRLPRRIASRPPVIATGTIGACAFSAMMNPPFLKGKSSSVRLRVPSGKIRKEFPRRIDSAASSMAASASSRRPRSTGTKPPVSMTMPRIGSFRNSALNRMCRRRCSTPIEHGRVDVALVVGAEDNRAPRRHVLAADDLVADARGGQRQPDAAVGQLVEEPLPLEGDGNQQPERAGHDDIE